MFFFFPFGILIPILVVLLAFRFGSRIFRDFFDYPQYWRRDFPVGGFSRRLGKSRLRRSPGTEASIFRLAYRLKGRITISDIVLETGLNMQEAEEAANKLVDGLRVRMEVDQRGLVIYEFPEILSRFDP